MVILWLDDVRDPNNSKIQDDFGAVDGMIWVKTALAAINRLKDNNVSFISFDHDLGPDSAGTGYEVAKWIEEKAALGELDRLEWAVHSQNAIGARNIERAMLSAERFWEKTDG